MKFIRFVSLILILGSFFVSCEEQIPSNSEQGNYTETEYNKKTLSLNKDDVVSVTLSRLMSPTIISPDQAPKKLLRENDGEYIGRIIAELDTYSLVEEGGADKTPADSGTPLYVIELSDKSVITMVSYNTGFIQVSNNGDVKWYVKRGINPQTFRNAIEKQISTDNANTDSDIPIVNVPDSEIVSKESVIAPQDSFLQEKGVYYIKYVCSSTSGTEKSKFFYPENAEELGSIVAFINSFELGEAIRDPDEVLGGESQRLTILYNNGIKINVHIFAGHIKKDIYDIDDEPSWSYISNGPNDAELKSFFEGLIN